MMVSPKWRQSTSALDEAKETNENKFTLKTVDIARAGLIGPDVGTFHMRDVIDSFWGGVANLSRTRNPKMFRDRKNIERGKEKCRELVAECWTSDENEKKNLVVKLDNLNTLYGEMSDTQTGKNILATDINKMNEFYDRWVLLLDNLVGEFQG